MNFRQHSGRVIALGRLTLAFVFLLAIWLDSTQPVHAWEQVYSLLSAYVLIAVALTASIWGNWWLDARLAAPAHFLDIGFFTLLVLGTDGYTSPFFLFFVFLLLSSAIRWSWRETAMTAAVLVLLYLTASILLGASIGEEFEPQKFVIRSGHLVILSALLIWFGLTHRSGRARSFEFPTGRPDDPPLETGLLTAAELVRAPAASLVWRSRGSDQPILLKLVGQDVETEGEGTTYLTPSSPGAPMLYDLKRNRAVCRTKSRRLVAGKASDWIHGDAARHGLREGLAIKVDTDSGRGEIFLEGIRQLSLDHLDIGDQLCDEFADHMRRHALLRAVEGSGEARARLSLARDFHDSVVQFLAAGAFRIEGMIIEAQTEGRSTADLEELKRLMLQEQDDLRSFIGTLRSDQATSLPQLVAELRSLAEKLEKQWEIECTCQSDVPDWLIPIRLHLDALQLVRESVANAVRHGRARAVRIRIDTQDDWVQLILEDNGRGFPTPTGSVTGPDDVHPRSLRERVADAGGQLAIERRDNGTSLRIKLPIRGRA